MNGDEEPLQLIARDPAAIAVARRRVVRHLERLNCANTEDVALVFSELVTNAVVHAAGAVRITVTTQPRTVRIDVHDRNPHRPEPRGDANVSGGRGLAIVDRLSERWGYEHSANGKVVWAVVPSSPPDD